MLHSNVATREATPTGRITEARDLIATLVVVVVVYRCLCGTAAGQMAAWLTVELKSMEIVSPGDDDDDDSAAKVESIWIKSRRARLLK